MRPNLFLATIGRGSNGSNALEVTEDRAAVTAESQDNIINRVNNISQYGPSWHYVPGIGVAGTAYVEVPGSALGDLAFSRASSKTRTNSAGVVETIAANVPPHDYRNADGTLSTFPRLNLEPQRTNSIRNSSMVGAVAGSPGTLPTNWGITNGGLTRSVVGIGTENGLPYIDFRLNGTATGSTALTLFESATGITAATGQTWTNSFYIKTISSSPNAFRSVIAEYTSAGGYVTENSIAITATSNLTRPTHTYTLAGGATVARVLSGLVCNLTNGAAYDFTIRIAAPQMELGAYATTWVPTTTAAVTRLADTASKTGVSSLIGQTEGTLYCEFNIGSDTFDGDLISVNGGSSANGFFVSFRNSKVVQLIVRTASTNALIFQRVGSYAIGTNKIAVAYKNGDFAISLNGTAAQVNTTTVTMPTGISSVEISVPRLYTSPMPIAHAQAALFTTRLTNATLAQMTTL